MICKICNKKFKSNAGLGHHIKSTHDMDTREYYDLYSDDTLKYCKICGTENKFINMIQGYSIGCCTEHTNLIKYRVVNTFQFEEYKEKAKQTKKTKYGDENYNNREKAKNTTIEVYGVENVSQNAEIREKIINTNLNNLGVEMPFMSNEIQEKCGDTKERKYGDKYYTNRDKYYTTMKEKGFISKEEQAFEKILLKLGIDFISQYKCDRYPYRCDFYLSKSDSFIELNIYPAHGPHPFDETNEDDIKLLNEWKQKSIHSELYVDWINRWTIKDKLKIQTAIINQLNYFTLYSLDEINSFIKTELNSDIDIKEIYQNL